MFCHTNCGDLHSNRFDNEASKLVYIIQLFLLAISYFLWWGYQMYSQPVQFSQPLLLQNLLIFGSVSAGIVTLSIQIFVFRTFIINSQYIAWVLLIALSIISFIWAIEPSVGVQYLKFEVMLIGLGILSVNSIRNKFSMKIWTYFLMTFSLLTLMWACFLIIRYGSLRAVPYDANTNYYVLISIIIGPISAHYLNNSRGIIRSISYLNLILSACVFVFSGSRIIIPVFICWGVGVLFLYDYKKIIGNLFLSQTKILSIILLCSSVLLVVLLYVYSPSIGFIERMFTQTAKEVGALSGPISDEDPARIQIYKYTLSLLSQPNTYIHGTGYHMFNIQFENYTQYAPYDPHNAYAKSLIELGMVGFILYFLIIIRPIRYALATIQESVSSNEKYVKAMLLAYLGILVFALFQPIWYHFQLYLISALLFGVRVYKS